MHVSDVKPGERVKNVHFTEDTIAVDLMDGRTIVVPLAWYPTLLEASPEQRSNWKISGKRATAFTGLISTRILVRRDSCVEHRLHRKRSILASKLPNTYEDSPSQETKISSALKKRTPRQSANKKQRHR